jgi:hypothetical protein
MKKGLVIVGVILLIVGLLMFLFMWPMIGTITAEELAEKVVNGESGTFKVMDELKQEDWDSMTPIEQEGWKLLDVDGPGTYVWTVELENGVATKTSEKYEKVPTMMGLLGLIILIVGVILMIVGAATGRAAPMPPMQPPMEQQPMGQPPMEQPPYEQPPAQPPY